MFKRPINIMVVGNLKEKEFFMSMVKLTLGKLLVFFQATPLILKNYLLTMYWGQVIISGLMHLYLLIANGLPKQKKLSINKLLIG